MLSAKAGTKIRASSLRPLTCQYRQTLSHNPWVHRLHYSGTSKGPGPCLPVWPVQLVQIFIVGLQAPQAPLDRGKDRISVQARCLPSRIAGDLPVARHPVGGGVANNLQYAIFLEALYIC